jgi:ATPases with chaperone activity, ATP-binding subunit
VGEAVPLRLADCRLRRVEERVTEHYSVPFTYSPAVLELITSRCNEIESGGRMIEAVLNNTMLPEVSRELLLRAFDAKPVGRISVDVADSEFTYAFE